MRRKTKRKKNPEQISAEGFTTRVYTPGEWPCPCWIPRGEWETDSPIGPIYPGDSATFSTEPLVQGDWALCEPGSGGRIFGRCFMVGGIPFVRAGSANSDFTRCTIIERLTAVHNAVGRARPFDDPNQRERFEAAQLFVKHLGFAMLHGYSNLVPDARRLAAYLGRVYLATRRWRRLVYKVENWQPGMDFTLPVPTKTLRARVA